MNEPNKVDFELTNQKILSIYSVSTLQKENLKLTLSRAYIVISQNGLFFCLIRETP